jgi:integrase
MSHYLQKRVNRWYAVLEIPKALRTHFGKPRFVRSLKTESRSVARCRVLEVVAGWKKEIAIAKGEPEDIFAPQFIRLRGGARLRPVSANAMLHALKNAKDEEERQSILAQIEDAAADLGSINVENIGDLPSSDPMAREFYGRATGLIVTFTEHLDEWLSTSSTTAKTQDMHRSDVKRFADEFQLVQDVSKPEVRRWAAKLMNDGGLAPKTVQRKLSGIRGYWRYLQSIGVAGEDDEPFSNLEVARQAKQKSPKPTRQPFDPDDVLRLLSEAINQEDDQLADLIRLGMWSGCRIEELCSLKVERVKDGYFSITDAKTQAGWRDVPIHRELAQTMTRLIDDSEDGYVLSRLSLNKYGDRSNAIGKRFGRLKSDMGYGEQHVFHSIRKTVVTILENAGAPENVVADIVGHEKTTMTYGLYSGGLSLAVKAEALDKLAY